MAVQTAIIDENKLNAFLGQLVGELGATVNAGLIVLGDRLGLYKAMAQSGPITSAELAEKTGTAERYTREWLNAQAAGNFVTYDPATQRYELPAEHALALANEDSPAFVCGAFELATASLKAESQIESAFRSGAGFGWHQHDPGVATGCERFFRPGYNANLVSTWLPALEGVDAKLRVGAKVADVGCGLGASTRLMAQAYPRSKFMGFDYHQESARGSSSSRSPGIAPSRTSTRSGAPTTRSRPSCARRARSRRTSVWRSAPRRARRASVTSPPRVVSRGSAGSRRPRSTSSTKLVRNERAGGRNARPPSRLAWRAENCG